MRALLLVVLVLLMCGCNSSPSAPGKADAPKPGETLPPFDSSLASSMLTRLLQAQQRKDAAGVQADLFPRASHTLNACAKTRIANSRSTAIGMAEDGAPPAEVTGVTLGSPRVMGMGYQVDYQAIGNAAFQGTEQFVWANGRWWIKCQM